MAEIEQPMPPWGPRYDPIVPIPHGLATPEVVSYMSEKTCSDCNAKLTVGEAEEFFGLCSGCHEVHEEIKRDEEDE